MLSRKKFLMWCHQFGKNDCFDPYFFSFSSLEAAYLTSDLIGTRKISLPKKFQRHFNQAIVLSVNKKEEKLTYLLILTDCRLKFISYSDQQPAHTHHELFYRELTDG